uniref:Uncharacterized protein n=1 Tax=Callorhinchus milii TaxID=7868 RepID=A0A4W3JYL1_CALMI
THSHSHTSLQPHEEIPAKKLRLTKPSKSAALHIDLCKSSSPTEALQYLLQFSKKPVEAESVEGVVRILLEHYYKRFQATLKIPHMYANVYVFKFLKQDH